MTVCTFMWCLEQARLQFESLQLVALFKRHLDVIFVYAGFSAADRAILQSHLLSDAGGPYPSLWGRSSARHIDSALLSGCCRKATNRLGTDLLCTALIGTVWLLVFLGAFAKLRKATSGFVSYACISVCASVRMEKLGSQGMIFLKFDIWGFFAK